MASALRKFLFSFYSLALVASAEASSPPIKTWVDLPTFRHLVRKCTNAIPEYNHVFQTDTHRAVFAGGGALRGVIAYIYRNLSAGYSPNSICNQFLGSITDFTQHGADRDLFVREGYSWPGNKGNWDILESSFWKASRAAGGSAIEKVLVRPDEIDDPFGALAAYHRGEHLYHDVRESDFAIFRTRTGLGGVTDNRKTALILRWLRFEDDLPGVAITESQYEMIRDIVFSEIQADGIESGNYWITKSLKKNFWSAVNRTGGQNFSWQKWQARFSKIGLGCHLARLGYSIQNGNTLVPLNTLFQRAHCFNETVQFQTEGARRGLARNQLNIHYRNLEVGHAYDLSYGDARAFLKAVLEEMKAMNLGKISRKLEDTYLSQPATLAIFDMTKVRDLELAEEFRKTFAELAANPAFAHSPYWSSISLTQLRSTLLGNPALTEKLFVHRTNRSSDRLALILDYAKQDSRNAANKLTTDLIEEFRTGQSGDWSVIDGVLASENPDLESAVGKSFNAALAELFERLHSEKSGHVLNSSYESAFARASHLISNKNLKQIAKFIENETPAAVYVIDLVLRNPSLWQRLAKQISPRARVRLAEKRIAGRLLSALATGPLSGHADTLIDPSFRDFLSTGKSTHILQEEFPKVRELLYEKFVAAVRDPSADANTAWKNVLEARHFYGPSATSTDILQIYSERFGLLPDLQSNLELWNGPLLVYPSASDYLFHHLEAQPNAFRGVHEPRAGANLKSLNKALTTHRLLDDFEVSLETGRQAGNNFTLTKRIRVTLTKSGMRKYIRRRCALVWKDTMGSAPLPTDLGR